MKTELSWKFLLGMKLFGSCEVPSMQITPNTSVSVVNILCFWRKWHKWHKWVGFNKVVFFSRKKEGWNWYTFYEFALWNKLLNIIVFWFCLRFVMCRKYGGKEDLSGSLYINILIQTVKLMTQKNRILETLKVSLTLTLLPSMIAQTKIFMRILRQR